MVKFVYLGLLALFALTSAQELSPGECDAEAHEEIIRGCNSACGNGTCRSPVNSKPYCACEAPPKPDTADDKYECIKYIEDLEQMMPSDQPIFGYECKGRCPEGQDLVTYVCDEKEGDSLVCVCSTPRFQQQVGSIQQSNMRGLIGGALDDAGLEDLLDQLEQALLSLAETVLGLLKTILTGAVKALVGALRAAVSTVKGVVSDLGV